MGKNLYKGDEPMSKKQSIDAKLQSELDNMKEALTPHRIKAIRRLSEGFLKVDR